MVRLLMAAFGLGTILNFFMSLFGLAIIFKGDAPLAYITCIIVAFMIICIKLSMETIYGQCRLLYRFFKLGLIVTIFLDACAVLNSVSLYIIAKQTVFDQQPEMNWVSSWTTGEISVHIVAAAIIIFLVGAPLALSYLLKEHLVEAGKESGETD